MLMALFCLIAYYWSQNPKPVKLSLIEIGSYPVKNLPNSGELFFVIGIFIILVSIILIFVLHLHVVVTQSTVLIQGLWTKKIIELKTDSIAEVRIVKFKNLNLKRPSYNLKHKGIVKFYTSGIEAVEMTINDGRKIRIGTQKSTELFEAIKKVRK
jgi:hypothetical protein